MDGRFVKSGGPEVAADLDVTGYAEWVKEPIAATKEE